MDLWPLIKGTMLRRSCKGLMCSCQGLARMARDAYCGLNVSEAEHAAGVLELRLVARGLSLGMRCTSVSLRNKWTTLLGKLLRRIAASTHCVLHKWDAAPGGAALGAAERVERDRDMDGAPTFPSHLAPHCLLLAASMARRCLRLVCTRLREHELSRQESLAPHILHPCMCLGSWPCRTVPSRPGVGWSRRTLRGGRDEP